MKYKVFDYTWHIPHQYDFINALKDDCEFFFCPNIKKGWDENLRPLPINLNIVPSYEKGQYDFAILHLDQQCIIENHMKRLIFDQFNSIITDIPKIIINHGSPIFPERFFQMGKYDLSEKEMRNEIVNIIKDLVGDNTMVVNSFSSAESNEWGFGHPIIHGMNPVDWIDGLKEPRVFTAMAAHGFDYYYNRECINKVSEILDKQYGYILSYAKLNINTDDSFDAYRHYLGTSLIYLDTSIRTPMNRGRTEAFLSGCCVMQVEGAHDLERWAVNDKNIILVPNDPEVISKRIVDLLEFDYQRALTIGANGRKMALKKFNYDRYKKDWLELFSTITEKHRFS